MANTQTIGNIISGSPVVTALLAVVVAVLVKMMISGTTKKINLPPGPRGLPFVGNFISLAFSKIPYHYLIHKWSKDYGKVLFFKIFDQGIVILNDAEIMQDTFQNNIVCDRPPYTPVDDDVGEVNCGIAHGNGQSWREQRKFFMSIFRKVDIGVCKLEDIIGDQVRLIIAKIRDYKGRSFDMADMVNLSVANIVMRIITGVTYEWDNEEFLEIVNDSARLFDIMGPAALFILNPFISRLPLSVNREIIHLTKKITDYIAKFVVEHQKEYNPNDVPKDFIETYLQEQVKPNCPKSFNDANLLVSCIDVLSAGWETVASTMRWTYYILACNPEAQDRMREEIHRVVGTNRFPTLADRQRLPLCDATIAECMRFASTVPIHFPHMANRDTKIGGYDVPKGTIVAGNLLYLAMDPKVFKDPEVFRPERFLDKAGNYARNLEPFLFGAGKRQCPGEHLGRMEMFIYTTYVVQHFKLRKPAGAAPDLEGVLGVTYRPLCYELQADDAIEIKDADGHN